MFRLRWKILNLFGIPIYIDASWLIIVVLLTWTFAVNLLPTALPGYELNQYIFMGLITALAFFACILLHELGHALVAKRVGIGMRGITLFLFGGVAEMTEEPPSAIKEFWMAIGGPLVTVALIIMFFALYAIGQPAGWPDPVIFILMYLGIINLVVLIFNMIPAFPLDGGRVLRSILWAASGSLRKSTYWASLSGRAFAWFLIFVAILFLMSGLVFQAVWFGLIGLFLNQAASASYQQVVIRQALQGEPVHRFMNPNPITVSPYVNLRDFVEEYVYRYHRKMYPVLDGNRLVGMITTADLSKIPREEWSQHSVEEIMRRDLKGCCITPDADALKALEQMQRTNLSRLLVWEDDQLVGIVSLKDLLRFLDVKLELGLDTDVPRRHDTGAPSAEEYREEYSPFETRESTR